MTLLPAVSSLGVMVMFAERSAVSGLSATATVSVVSPSVPSVAERVIHSLAASSTAALQVIPSPEAVTFTLWPAAPSASKVSTVGSTVSA